MINIGNNIKTNRKKMKLTQPELAHILFISPATLIKWERGVNEPNISMLDRLATLFEITIDDLIHGGQDITRLERLELIIGSHEEYFLQPSEKPANIVYEKGLLDGLKKALNIIYGMHQ